MCAFSIIIPVLNEADRIINLVSDLSRLDPDYDKEIIVVDGSPDCDTIRAITDPNIHCITSSCGRARQMNAGAAEAKGQVLIFLHADTRLPDNALALIDAALAGNEIAAGAFDLAIDSIRILHRMLGRVASIRSRLTRIRTVIRRFSY